MTIGKYIFEVDNERQVITITLMFNQSFIAFFDLKTRSFTNKSMPKYLETEYELIVRNQLDTILKG